MRINEERLVKISVQGRILSPGEDQDYMTGADGAPFVMPSCGGICYNVKVGDCCMGLLGDHIEPGVSVGCAGEGEGARKSFSTISCIGNEAVVASGAAKGRTGLVTGKHDLDRVIVHFDGETLNLLTHDDAILIRGYGQGLSLPDFPGVKVMNADPALILGMGLGAREGRLTVRVAKKIPPCLLGSGMGGASAYRGDVDIMTRDEETVRELGLDTLRFGDIVLLEDCDCSYGRDFRRGAATVGVVSHSDSKTAGHGPGVTAILTGRGAIEGILSEGANIAFYHPIIKGGI
ncbi:MAG: DUF4438 domain-containing protein [Oscillospiraceae bacterium]|jgi:hypothetical protein|nr:DUF4438 domain-containing protein [Oscillospiraceae bacterium]